MRDDEQVLVRVAAGIFRRLQAQQLVQPQIAAVVGLLGVGDLMAAGKGVHAFQGAATRSICQPICVRSCHSFTVAISPSAIVEDFYKGIRG
jgi:hypothetical protein